MSQNAEKQIKKIIQTFITRQDNLIVASRLFVAKSVLIWASENTKDLKAFKAYMSEIERHLSGEITLYWEDGIIKVRKEKQV